MYQALILLIQTLFATGGNVDLDSQVIRQQLGGGNFHGSSVSYSQESNTVTVQTPGGNIIIINPEENN